VGPSRDGNVHWLKVRARRGFVNLARKIPKILRLAIG
jgi:hypothetical protein